MLDYDPIILAIRLPIVLLALTIHELCHGYFAYRMGDPTAYMQGRLTLNPLKHLDPLGTICLIFGPIGWAKPVPINVLNFRDRRKGILVSTAAGPLSNLAQAVLFALALRAIIYVAQVSDAMGQPQVAQFVEVACIMCVMAVFVNVCLAMFNALPLHPLDGFHVTMQLLRPELRQRFAETRPFGIFAIIGIILVERMTDIDILGRLFNPPVNFILKYVAGFDMSLV